MRILAMIYSLVCYFLGVAALVMLIFFIGDLVIPVSINEPFVLSPELPFLPAIVANTILIILWSAQHSVMADPRFKSWWTQFVHPAVERSTFVLSVALATFLLISFWSPIPFVIWEIQDGSVRTVLTCVYLLGWSMTLFASFLINHFQLFGLEQAYRFLTETQSKKSIFVTPLLYRLVRHPMMTGILISLWCVPTMTVGRLLFNVVMTIYIVVGTRHEEQTLSSELGEEYEDYRKTTPMLVPGLGTSSIQQASRQ